MGDKVDKPFKVLEGGYKENLKLLKDTQEKYFYSMQGKGVDDINIYVYFIENRQTQEMFIGMTPYIDLSKIMNNLSDDIDTGLTKYQQVFDILISFYQERFFVEYKFSYDKMFKFSQMREAKEYVSMLYAKQKSLD